MEEFLILKLIEVLGGMDQFQGELFFKIKFKKIIGCMGKIMEFWVLVLILRKVQEQKYEKGIWLDKNNIFRVRLIDVQNYLFYFEQYYFGEFIGV